MEELLKYKIGISLLPKIGAVNAKKLIAYTGGIDAVFKEKKSKLKLIPGIGPQLSEYICNQNVLARAEQEIEFINKKKLKSLFYLDEDYPERLKHCVDAPIMIYVRGDVNFQHEKVISIVGTRNATQEGRANCKKLIQELVKSGHNPIIVSGLAYGIDICAHKAALDNGLPTVAVLAHGLDRIYPSLHASQAERIIRQGALVSEFMSQTKIDRNYFLRRNRIIAGLSDATIVVESDSKGGALVTADIAMSYNREVFAFPGRVSDQYSRGCNMLIKRNKAVLLENVKDIEYHLNWDIKKKQQPVQGKLFLSFSTEEEQIHHLLQDNGPQTIDVICRKSQMAMNKVSTLLLQLEFSGVVKSLPGKMYALC